MNEVVVSMEIASALEPQATLLIPPLLQREDTPIAAVSLLERLLDVACLRRRIPAPLVLLERLIRHLEGIIDHVVWQVRRFERELLTHVQSCF